MDKGNKAQSRYIINQCWQFIPGQKLLKQPGHSHVLRNKTADVLLLLLQTPGQVVQTSTFFDVVWRGKFVSENVLKQSISEIRQCLGDEHKKLIVTLPKTGYLLQCDVDISDNETDKLLPEEPASLPPELDTAQFETNNPSQPTANAPSAIENNKAVTSQQIRLAKYSTLAASVAFIIGGVILATFLYSQQADLQASYNKNDELNAGLALYRELHKVSVQHSQQAPQDAKWLLDKKLQELLDTQSTDFTYIGQLEALKELYFRKGHFSEARLLAGRLERCIESRYGQYSERSIRTKLDTITILLELRRREEAFNLGNYVLAEVQEHFPNNKKLLADVNYHVSRVNLFCVEPFCQRKLSLAHGEQYARKALDFYQTKPEQFNIEIADTKVLLNWFLFNGQEKKALMDDALRIYLHEFGQYHTKTIDAQEELSRALAFYEHNWDEAERLLTLAAIARNKMMPEKHQSIAKQKRYLGELYFMSGKFQQSIPALTQAKVLTAHNIGKNNNVYLEQLMLKARAHLYLGQVQESMNELNEAHTLIEESKMTPGIIIKRAIEVTQLRLDTFLQRSNQSPAEIQQAMAEHKDVFKSPKSVAIHEYQSQLLALYPKEVNEQYLSSIKALKQQLNVRNRYFYPADYAFIQARALYLCQQHSATFCKQVANLVAEGPNTLVDVAMLYSKDGKPVNQ
ncbi:transcriptional regulator [Flocculibacter collagenilyticus]|uniref:transcriptional regulator n=1 Tax=Flocculibacter collagenilyticus TaxID=2744479 RepID=UPI0018F48C8F|nr:winged helix-turn-helix domain-containing protein [Flocculibacter collagenilyticus]